MYIKTLPKGSLGKNQTGNFNSFPGGATDFEVKLLHEYQHIIIGQAELNLQGDSS